MENWPFSKSALNEYGKQKSPAGGNNNKLKLGSNINSPSVGSKLVASPNLSSKFGPSLTLSKSPMNKGKSLDVSYGDGMDSGSKNFLGQFQGRNMDRSRHKTTVENKEFSLKFLQQTKSTDKTREKSKERSGESNVPSDHNEHINKIPNRKVRNNLKNIDTNTNENNNGNKSEYTDLPIMPAVKTIINKPNLKQENNFSTKLSMTNNTSGQIILETPEISVTPATNGSNVNGNGNHLGYNNANREDFNNFQQSPEEYEDFYSDEEVEPLKCEGYLFKITDSKRLKKLWFKLHDKDFYYFKNEKENEHKGMHNLSGLFVKEEKQTIIDNINYFCFSVTYPKKVRFYYAENEAEMNKWISSIKRATGYADLTDIYEVREKLGNGKFGSQPPIPNSS